MKNLILKIALVCKRIFGYGILATLFLGGLTFFGYVAAFIIGGNTAAGICTFIYKEIIPIIIYAANSLILLGLLAMYLSGECALVPRKKQE